jgi:alpha,alpha-trehalase
MDDAWTLTYDDYAPAEEGLREVLCALGNGVLVSRGALAFAGAADGHYPGTYMAGGYDRAVSEIAGLQVENEDLVNLPNWLPLTFRIDDGDWLHPTAVRHLEHRRALSLSDGVLAIRLRIADDQGRITRLEERRLVSMHRPQLAALEVRLTPENWSGTLSLRAALDGSVVNAGVARYRDLEGRHLETLATGTHDGITWLRSRMRQSRTEVALAARLALRTPGRIGPRRIEELADVVAEEVPVELRAGETVTAEKVAAYVSSRDAAISEPVADACAAVADAGGFDALAAAHRTVWQHLWNTFDIRLDAADGEDPQLKLRLHRFHLLQTASPHTTELDVGVPPRGWHGEAYRGHVMWDEMFILPSLTLRSPELTRALVGYRYRRLPAARRAAREAGYRGAMFPWQSGSNGREESQRRHLNPMSGRWVPDNSWRQRHIGAAVAYNAWKYWQVTDDWQFLCDQGAELILEIARFWSSIATERADGRFDIKGVMGPDEFHTAYPGADPTTEGGLDNNAYTNVMAAWVLARALELLELLPDQRRRALVELLGIDDAERARWDRISRRLVVPFHDDGIISQFEGFERLEPFPFADYRERYDGIRRLDRILEREGDDPNRYQVSKQADVLMLFYLFSTEELREVLERLGYVFEPEMIFNTICWYMERTVHGSTLSWLTHAWVLARADREQSWRLALTALDSDFADLQGGTTPEGIHLGAMAGTVDLMERCYTGLEARAHALVFNPHLPSEVSCLRTTIHYRRQVLDVVVDHARLAVTSRPTTAAPVVLAYRATTRAISPGQRITFTLVPEHKADRAARVVEQRRVAGEARSEAASATEETTP